MKLKLDYRVKTHQSDNISPFQRLFNSVRATPWTKKGTRLKSADGLRQKYRDYKLDKLRTLTFH